MVFALDSVEACCQQFTCIIIIPFHARSDMEWKMSTILTGKGPIIAEIEIALHCLIQWQVLGSYLDIRICAGIRS